MSEAEYLAAFEEHSPAGIRRCLAAGASATLPIKGKRPIDCLIEGYLRSPRFGECLRVLLEAGAEIGDPLVEAVLLDDAAALCRVLESGGKVELGRRVRVPSAFTSCDGVTALHLAAEYNSVHCARVLLEAGADPDARADLDGNGFRCQTPIFRAVNSIFNYCRPTMDILVGAGASLEVQLKGLVWGRGADWETLVLDVTPFSYAQCGLFPQWQRREQDVSNNLSYLYSARYGTDLTIPNIPNRYLQPRG